MVQLTVAEVAEHQGVTYSVALGYAVYMEKLGRAKFVGTRRPLGKSGRGKPAKVYEFDNDAVTRMEKA